MMLYITYAITHAFTFLEGTENNRKLPQCEIHPTHCCVNDSANILIDLPGIDVCRLIEPKCKVIFCGQKSRRSVTVDGFRRNHDYGIRASFPVWYEKDNVNVTVETKNGTILASGTLEVLEKRTSGRQLTAVAACLEQTGDWCCEQFLKNVVGVYLSSTQLKHFTLSTSSMNMSLLPVFIDLSDSGTAITDVFDRVLTFAMCNGLPTGMSMVDMFFDVPNLKSVMEASVYAHGSLQLLVNVVHSQSSHQYVRDQINMLVSKVDKGSSISSMGVSHEGSQNFENSKLSKTGGDVYPYGHCPQVDKNVYISSTGVSGERSHTVEVSKLSDSDDDFYPYVHFEKGAPNAKTDIDITFTNDRLENSGHSVSSLSDVNPKQSSESESDYLMPIALLEAMQSKSVNDIYGLSTLSEREESEGEICYSLIDGKDDKQASFKKGYCFIDPPVPPPPLPPSRSRGVSNAASTKSHQRVQTVDDDDSDDDPGPGYVKVDV
ncbi:uncharacterized protein LOC134188080 isoform X2 [Corticium candelabrum]|uniref:uncharacterized protein LOC134188080 isoform X2 n=1 Tax=Corticium candelabrum TaxID=121492 RepID=UPI002E256801|nr:uncharacterized protein LOC134188080 isoform X2 [Corticium candelabrum]